MKFKRRKYIEQLTTQILQETQCFNQLPINIKEVAFKRGLTIKPHPLGEDREGNEISGVLVVKDGKGTIGYNKTHPKVRVRFTIAHEIGHYELQHQRGGLFVDKPKNHLSVQFRDNKSSTGEDIQEQEANAFAAALLMPAEKVKQELQKTNFDLSDETDKALKKLANDFEVSTQAMAFRLANLGYLQLM